MREFPSGPFGSSQTRRIRNFQIYCGNLWVWKEWDPGPDPQHLYIIWWGEATESCRFKRQWTTGDIWTSFLGLLRTWKHESNRKLGANIHKYLRNAFFFPLDLYWGSGSLLGRLGGAAVRVEVREVKVVGSLPVLWPLTPSLQVKVCSSPCLPVMDEGHVFNLLLCLIITDAFSLQSVSVWFNAAEIFAQHVPNFSCFHSAAVAVLKGSGKLDKSDAKLEAWQHENLTKIMISTYGNKQKKRLNSPEESPCCLN